MSHSLPLDAAYARRSYLRDLELLYLLVLKELRVRYKGSVLGYLWAVANPLAYTLVYYVVFQIIMRVQVPNYGVYLVTGLFPWAWTTGTLVQSASAYRGNESLIKKVNLRRAVLPLATAVQEMLHLFFAFPVLIAGVVMATGTVHLSWLVLVPCMAVVQLAMLYPVGLILACANVIVRDVEYLVAITLQLLFFLTPIVYEPAAIPKEYAWLFDLNPFSSMISAWRAIFYHGSLDAPAIGRCLLFAAMAGLLAWYVHRTLDPRIGELL